MSQKTQLTGKIDCIQALRILAAVCLAIYHMGGVKLPGLRLQMGVNLLYCVSAFLLMYTTQDVKRTSKFFVKRLIRIVPLYWIMTILTFLAIKAVPTLAASQGDVSTKQLIYSMFFIPYNRTVMKGEYSVARPIVGPAWTLYWDIYFAIIFSIVMKIDHKKRGYISAGVCALLSIIGFVFDFTGIPFLSVIFSPFWCNFVAGIIVFEIVHRYWDKIQSKRLIMVRMADIS